MRYVWSWWAFGTHNGFADLSVDMLKDPASPAVAAIANARQALLDRVDQCRAQHGRLPNLIAVDFYATGDLYQVVDELKRVAVPAG